MTDDKLTDEMLRTLASDRLSMECASDQRAALATEVAELTVSLVMAQNQLTATTRTALLTKDERAELREWREAFKEGDADALASAARFQERLTEAEMAALDRAIAAAKKAHP